MNEETPLSGGMSTESVVRIGDVVHRTKSANYVFKHELLLHLERSGFPYVPRGLGTDEQGREMLSYIEGEVPRDHPLSYQQIVSAIKILRRFHDLLADSNLSGAEETVCHNDFAPWNTIVNGGEVVGVIDFDEAAPGRRVDDVAYFIWTFLDLGTSPRPDAEQVERLVGLAQAYGLESTGTIVPALLRQQRRILAFREEMSTNSPDEAMREFSAGAIIRIRTSMSWVEENREAIVRG